MKTKPFAILTSLFFILVLVFSGCNSPRKEDAAKTSITEIKPIAAEVNKDESTMQTDNTPWKWDGEASSPRVYKPEDPDNPIYMGSDGKLAGRGDPNRPASEAYRLGMGQHVTTLQAAPHKDKFGLVDWVKMVDKKVINPAGSLVDEAEAEPQMDMDIVIPVKSDFIKDVTFSHNLHTYWVGCTVCHDKLFVMVKGENNMTMKGISEGKWCGSCHGKVAFPLADCSRCHARAKVAAGR